LLGAGTSKEAVRFHALSVVAECVFYCLAAENPDHPLAQLAAGLPGPARLARCLSERSLRAVQRQAAAPKISKS